MLKSADQIITLATKVLARKPDNDAAADMLERAKVAVAVSEGMAKLRAMRAMVEAGLSWHAVHTMCEVR